MSTVCESLTVGQFIDSLLKNPNQLYEATCDTLDEKYQPDTRVMHGFGEEQHQQILDLLKSFHLDKEVRLRHKKDLIPYNIAFSVLLSRLENLAQPFGVYEMKGVKDRKIISLPTLEVEGKLQLRGLYQVLNNGDKEEDYIPFVVNSSTSKSAVFRKISDGDYDKVLRYKGGYPAGLYTVTPSELAHLLKEVACPSSIQPVAEWVVSGLPHKITDEDFWLWYNSGLIPKYLRDNGVNAIEKHSMFRLTPYYSRQIDDAFSLKLEDVSGKLEQFPVPDSAYQVAQVVVKGVTVHSLTAFEMESWIANKVPPLSLRTDINGEAFKEEGFKHSGFRLTEWYKG